MLQRKITKQIEEFYNDNPKKALMITGARQVGNYCSYFCAIMC
jgi:hypothetical protein